jgi:dienelactone hydrolase
VLGWPRVLIAAFAAAASLAPHGAAAAPIVYRPSGLPVVTSGPRPGPDILYAAAPVVPQLSNLAPWRAEPILVSGASAYRDGEFLYQDFLFDDRGARGDADSDDPWGGIAYKPHAGTLTYPADPAFANNAADLVEFRVRRLPDETALRVTVNSLHPTATAFVVAIGSSAKPVRWPYRAGVSSPASLFLTVHGTWARLSNAAGATIGPAPTVRLDTERKQFDVRIPHAAWNPGRGSVRLAAGLGLWNAATGTFATPRADRTAKLPGGASDNGAALFNVAFRGHEAMPGPRGDAPAVLVDSSKNPKMYRDLFQARALAKGDVSGFFANVDFSQLAEGVRDDSRVPKTGPLNRIAATHHAFGQGFDPTKACGRQPVTCEGVLRGQLHPYALYVPSRPTPPAGYGLTLMLHSLYENHNQYTGTTYQRQMGERGAGSLVVTPGSRGPDGDYTDALEAETFDVWAAGARHYPLDPDWVAATGYSMGGGGVHRLMARYPDLFARGMSGGAVPIRDQGTYPASLRNNPLMTYIATGDEGTSPPFQQKYLAEMNDRGYRYFFRSFPASEHLKLQGNDEYADAAAFLGGHHVNRDPMHVTYVVDPRLDYPALAVVADHAYWLSGITLRERASGARGVIDVRSDGFGLADPVARRSDPSAGVLRGRNGAEPYFDRVQTWEPPKVTPPRNRLVIRATNIASVVIDARRARVGCRPELVVKSDGPLDIRVVC